MKLFQLLIICAVLVAFVAEAGAWQTYTTRYYGAAMLAGDAPDAHDGATGHQGVYQDGSETRTGVYKFDFDYSWTEDYGRYGPERDWANAFADRGDVLEVGPITLFNNRHRTTFVGEPVIDIYRLKREIETIDFYEWAYGGETSADPNHSSLVTWNQASDGDNWETAGAKGATDRYATPLLSNYAVTEEYPFDFTIAYGDAQWLVDVLNNGENLSLLYELDSTSSSDAHFEISAYRACYSITFEYDIPEPSMIGIAGIALLTLLRKKK